MNKYKYTVAISATVIFLMTTLFQASPRGITLLEEGVVVGNFARINFIGPDVTVTDAGNGTANVTIADAIGSINVENTVFIDNKFGNNATGLPERQDFPFATKQAALTAALAFYDGIIAPLPSATHRILMYVQNESSTQRIPLSNFFDWNLNGGIIAVATGGFSCIDDNNVACDTVIYNVGSLIRNGLGTGGAIHTQNAGTILKVYAIDIFSSLNWAVQCTNGSQDIKCINITGASDQTHIRCFGGTQYIECKNISSTFLNAQVILNQGGIQTIKCSTITQTSGGNGIAIYSTTSSTQNIYADSVIAVGAAVINELLSTAIQNIFINEIRSTGLSTGAVIIRGGTSDIFGGTIYGRSAFNGNAISKTGGVLKIRSVTLIASGTGETIAATTPQNVLCYGASEGNLPYNVNVTPQVGILIIDANVV